MVGVPGFQSREWRCCPARNTSLDVQLLPEPQDPLSFSSTFTCFQRCASPTNYPLLPMTLQLCFELHISLLLPWPRVVVKVTHLANTLPPAARRRVHAPHNFLMWRSVTSESSMLTLWYGSDHGLSRPFFFLIERCVRNEGTNSY